MPDISSLLIGSIVLLWILLLGVALSVLRVQQTVGGIQYSLERRAAEGPPEGGRAPMLLGRIFGWRAGKLQISEGVEILAADPRPILLWFMGAGCRPCQHLLPTVSAIADEYGASVRSVVTAAGAPEEIRFLAERVSPSVTVIADPERVNAKRWQVHMTPFVIVVDAGGTIRRKIAEISLDQVQLALDGLVDESIEAAAT